MESNLTFVSSGWVREYEGPGVWELIQISVFIFLGALTVIFNLFIFAVLKTGEDIFDDVTVLLFRSLAMTDIVAGLVVSVLEGTLYYFNEVPNSSAVCAYTPFATFFTILNSIVHVTLMNIQRYVSVMYPFRYIRLVTVKRVRLCLTGLKFSLLGLCVMLLPFSKFPLELFTKEVCVSRSLHIGLQKPGILTMSSKICLGTIAALAFLPLLVLTYTNSRLLLKARRIGQRRVVLQVFARGNSDGIEIPDRGQLEVERGRSALKGLKTVLIITILSYISTIPFIIGLAMAIIQPEWGETVYSVMYFIAVVFMVSSCWWNAPVYMLTSVTFRKKVMAILGKGRCSRKQETS